MGEMSKKNESRLFFTLSTRFGFTRLTISFNLANLLGANLTQISPTLQNSKL